MTDGATADGVAEVDAQGPAPLGTIALTAVTLYVTDLDEAIAWYRTTFGLDPVMVGKDAERYASYVLGGAVVVLEPRSAALEAAPPGSESTTLNLIVDVDPAEARRALLARGARCGDLVVSPGFASFLVRDLDGNRFYVTRPRTEQARAGVAEATTRTTL
ncbi:MAG TPA: VOC family protein [Acidimicrobiales bacterium]|nr:VOC family protein [Acidimicrobiales bacterium]